MEKVKFGNWTVTAEAITWQQDEDEMDYEISIDNLTTRVQNNDFFDWLTHVPIKTWMTKEDTYALNTAFLYVLAEHNIQLTNKMRITNMLSEQVGILDTKNDRITAEEIYRNIKGPRN